MLIFLAGHCADGAADGERAAGVLRSIVGATPFAEQFEVRSWEGPDARVALAWAVHRQSLLGDVAPVACEESRTALVAGRPIRWRGDGDADGREPPWGHAHLDGILDRLDGRFAVVRADDHTLEVHTDVFGAYPVYAATAADGTWWASGLVAALVPFCVDRRLDERAVASLLATGWSLDGQPAVRGVRRLPRGATLRLDRYGRRLELAATRPHPVALLGGRVDHGAAARDLVAALRALADWPGRPTAVPVTGGRDSRVILAAALASGISFEAVTAGGPEVVDVQVGRALCAAAGIPHRLYAPGSGRWLGTDPAVAATLLRLRGGTATLGDAAGFPVTAEAGPLPLWHSGQGGEIARGYYGTGAGPEVAVREALDARLTGWRPWRPIPLRGRARRHVRGLLREWAGEWTARGATAADLPQLAYVDLRMGFWAGPGHGAVEWIRDTTSPLWSWKLLPALLSGSPAERRRETLHRRLVELLAPQLVGVPFEDGRTWGEPRATTTAADAQLLADDVPAVPPRPFADVQALARAGLAAPTRGAIAALVHPKRAARLLGAPEGELDWRERMWVWNLLTAVGAPDADLPGAAPPAA